MAKMLKVDYGKCTGCRACEMVCSLVHSGECNPHKSNIHNVNIQDEKFVSVMCFQCEDSPCAKTCPMKAIEKDLQSGEVKVNEERCVGCKLCVLACPFGNMSFSVSRHHAVKCDLCDGEPQCVFYCSPGAISFVDLSVENLKKKEDLSQRILEAYSTSKGNHC